MRVYGPIEGAEDADGCLRDAGTALPSRNVGSAMQGNLLSLCRSSPNSSRVPSVFIGNCAWLGMRVSVNSNQLIVSGLCSEDPVYGIDLVGDGADTPSMNARLTSDFTGLNRAWSQDFFAALTGTQPAPP